MNKIAFIFIFLFHSSQLFAQNIVWKGDQKSINIGQEVYVLKDPEGIFSIEDVVGKYDQFQQSEKKILNFGFSDSYYWLRISIANNTNQNLLLEIAHAFLPVAEMHHKNRAGVWESIHEGYKKGLYNKIIQHHQQIFPINKGTHDYYIRLQPYSMPTPINLWEENALVRKIDRQKINYGVYAGILLFVMLNNILLYFTFRRYHFILYALLVLLYAGISAIVVDGYILYLFPSMDMLFWYSKMPAINMPVALLYCITFLELKKYSKRMYKVALGMLAYFVLNLVIQPLIPLHTEQLINTIQALILFLLITTLALRTAKKGNRFANMFALAFFIWFVFVLLESLYVQYGYPPHFIDISHVSIAIFFEVFLLSYLLSKRFEWEKEEAEKAKTEAQQNLLVQTQENERIVKEQNIILEEKVIDRTSQLKEANEELTTLLETVEDERQKSESLLLNILPSTTARELKELGNAKPQNYQMVSVLFTDFVDFTRLTADLPPEQLVNDLNNCFSEFDRIIQKHNIEKIKTIGDAYMAAGGIPVPTALHALDTLRAALEIRDFMQEWNAKRMEQNEFVLNIRIGVHSGSVIAGVVGTHKFSYDIWGDTVNIASRIESNGQAGKVNISEATYNLIKDSFTCTSRGKIDVKGKGELEMFWVEPKADV